MRVLAILLFLLAGHAAAANPPSAWVDLDQPGQLERLQQRRPEHYRIVQQILREAPKRPIASWRGWMQASFAASSASGHLLKTSFPAKAQLQFQLDDTQYRAQLTLRDDVPQALPAKGLP